MRGGWAIWLVAAAGSLAAHLGLVTALSGMTLEPPPPPLADLYLADAASEAPLEVEAVVAEEALPLEAEAAGVEEIAAAEPDPEPVAETPVMKPAEAVPPAETEAAAAKDVEPRLSPVEETAPDPAQLRPEEEAAIQAAIEPPAELPEAEKAPVSTESPASPVAETGTQAPELAAAEDAASPVAETQESAQALDPAADTVSPPAAETAAETAPLESGSGKVDPNLSPRAEAVAAEGTAVAARADAVAAAAQSTAAETPAVSSTQEVSQAETPVQPAETSGQTTTPKEPIASATSQPQEQQVAALPPVSELPMTRRDRIGRFLREDYDGGACLFVEVAGPDRERPRLNGFVTEAEAIPKIGNAFRRSVGVEPEIAMRRMMEAQCPAVDFIGRLKRNRALPIFVRLASDVVRGSDLLVGRLTRATLPYTLLFIVDDDGIVHNLTDDLLPDVDGQTFAAEIHHTADGKSRNQLIVAVGSTVALEVPGPRRVGEAALFLQRLQAEAGAQGATLALGYATFRAE